MIPVGLRRFAIAFFWWVVTLGTLLVLDDLTFGPAFWWLSRTAGREVASTTAFCLYLGAQILLVYRGTTENPGRLAGFFLRRLDLTRRHAGVEAREKAVRSGIVGGMSAVLAAPVIGGVIPPLVLWRIGFSQRYVRSLVLLTAPVYAAEFAFIHGWLPAAI